MQTEPNSTNPVACKTMSVPDAGRLYFGLSRNSSYEAAARGEIPTIRIGRKIRVPVTAMERLLEAAGSLARAA
jgi:excisionase family DNA binding protein